MFKLAIVPRYFRALAVSAVVPGVLVAGLLAPAPAAANCCGSGPSIVVSSSGGTVTASGSGYTQGGTVDVLERYCFGSCSGYYIVATTTANTFTYHCSGSVCQRVWVFTVQFPASPCYPLSDQYYARDEVTGADSNLTQPIVVC